MVISRKVLLVSGSMVILLLSIFIVARIEPKINQTGSQNIVVVEPSSNQAINNPVILRGKARTFEYYVEYRVRDADGTILAEGNFISSQNNDPPPYYGNFDQKIGYNKPRGHQGTVELFESSAKDGAEINKIIIPVTFR